MAVKMLISGTDQAQEQETGLTWFPQETSPWHQQVTEHESRGVLHSTDCPHKGEGDKSLYGMKLDTNGFQPDCGKYCRHQVYVTLFPEAVLCTRERNGYHDSDFYAVVWDGQRLTSFEYATTRGWTYANGAKVDATDEVKAQAQAWLERWARDELEVAYSQEAHRVKLGKIVVVERGRKVPQGTVGQVEWIGPGKYRAERVRIKTDDGETYWTDSHNCGVKEPERYIPLPDKMDEMARQFAERRQWHRPFATPGFFQV